MVARKMRKTHFISDKNMKKRYEWAKEFEDWDY